MPRYLLSARAIATLKCIYPAIPIAIGISLFLDRGGASGHWVVAFSLIWGLVGYCARSCRRERVERWQLWLNISAGALTVIGGLYIALGLWVYAVLHFILGCFYVRQAIHDRATGPLLRRDWRHVSG